MAKKSRRKRQPRRTRPKVHREKTVERKVDLSQEYPYVVSDLKRLAIVAGAMLALLIALSFLIR